MIMHFKLIICFVEDSKTDEIMEAARIAGATGATIINNARGEGLTQNKTFFGLTLETQRDVVLFLVEQHLSSISLRLLPRWGSLIINPERVLRSRLMWKMLLASAIKLKNY